MKAGGFYLNSTKITHHQTTLTEQDLIDGKVVILRIGKSSFYLIEAI